MAHLLNINGSINDVIENINLSGKKCIVCIDPLYIITNRTSQEENNPQTQFLCSEESIKLQGKTINTDPIMQNRPRTVWIVAVIC